ncbi:carbohydrate kinase family protein [Patescibacteria group bacterium]|nr:carbohydrate kinase family protein [Patescibacteria group bacterium]MBU1868633.1 carbohydrate kinase family protein [Patescibacteria group bacterium]
MFDIVSIGHATVDFFLELDPKMAPLMWSEKKKESFVCLDFDDKTPVKKTSWSLGGNAVNSGIGLCRLGVNIALVSEVGQDEWGDLVRRVLLEEKLKLDYFRINPGQVTDLSVILILKGERTILAYHYPRDYWFPEEFPKTKWIYLTSLGKKFPAFHDQLILLLEQTDIRLAYNPGMHELLVGREASSKIIKRSEVLLVNREEAGELVGQRPSQVNEQLLIDLRNLGPEIVVITDGKDGSFAYDGNKFYQQGVCSAERVEMTGAGDSFSAGFLAALTHDKGITEALKWGTVNSASVIGFVGSTEGLLTLDVLEERVSRL